MLGFGKTKRELHIPWRPGDPLTFEDYQGQDLLKQRLRLRLDAMQVGEQFKGLFYAPFGRGKTSLARTVAYEMFRRNLIESYIETIGANFETKADVDQLMNRLTPQTFVFIDEIHTLASGAREAFFLAIQDNIYVYHRKQNFVTLPPGISWAGATTELGKVHPSLQRRLIPMSLEPLTTAELAAIARGQALDVTPNAAAEMALRCSSPWEIRDELYATAADYAKVQNESAITLDIVRKSCDILGIDEQGLRPLDRRILETLHRNYKILGGERAYCMSKNALIAIAGIDTEAYSNQVEPKLLEKGYLTISSSGRELTMRAIDLYFP